MKAYLVDPEKRTVTEANFDGNENTIARLIGCDDIAYEQFTGIERIYHDFSIRDRVDRVYFAADADENPELPGFVIEETGGRVNHGKCLVVGVDTRAGHFVDAIDVRDVISHYYVPGRGAY